MSHNITVAGGTSVRLKTAGKYCDQDIVVTAEGGAAPVLQSKIVIPTKEAQTVTPDDGYDGLLQVRVRPIPDEYIEVAGTKYITENGGYDVSQYASVNVNVETGGGNEIDSLIANTITEIERNVKTIRNYCFYGCTAMTSASFPLVTTIPTYCFYGCTKLASVSFPMATSTGNYAFRGCTVLKTLDLPLIKTLGTHTFYACSSLTSVKFPLVTAITSNLFYGCAKMKTVDIPAKSIAASAFANNYTLTALILRGTTMATLANTNAFTGCYHLLGTKNTTYNPNALKDCYIYVQSELVSSYQTASNWSTHSTQFRALEDYTVDGTIDGELDPIKVAAGGSGGGGGDFEIM